MDSNIILKTNQQTTSFFDNVLMAMAKEEQ